MLMRVINSGSLKQYKKNINSRHRCETHYYLGKRPLMEQFTNGLGLISRRSHFI
jgi:hypothetical protein